MGQSPIFVLLLIVVALVARADFDASKWKLRRPLNGAAAGLGAIVLDRNVFAGARTDFADLRVLLDGRELNNMDTLADVGIESDAELEIAPDVQAG